MGFSSASGSVEQKSWFDRYVEDKDNIKDIKDDLGKLKKNIQNTETSVTKDEKVDYSNKENFETTQTREQFADGMDAHIESIFDAYITDPNNQSRIKAMILEWDSWIGKLQEEFNQKIWGNAITAFSTEYSVLMSNAILPFTFELNGLKEDIKQELTQTKGGNAWRWDWYNNWVNESNTTASEHIETGYHADKDYVDPYGYWNVNTNNFTGENDIYDIHKDNKTRKVLEELFDDETTKELRKWTFNVNLDKEDGLAGIIISLREAMIFVQNYDEATATEEQKKQKENYDKIFKYDPTTKIWQINTTTSNLKIWLENLIASWDITYTKKWGLDNEINKIAKILSRSSRENLDTFAALAQSKDNITTFLKERYNAGITTWVVFDDKDRKEYDRQWIEARRESAISSKNVFMFLCDFNGDLLISTEYKKRNNPGQKNQGDVGPVFGQQVMFSIEQAIKLQDIEYPGKWEQKVIHNIIKNMDIRDKRFYHVAQQELLDDMISDEDSCTKENLVKLINGYLDTDGTTYIPGMPEMKIFFLDAIKTMNGWTEATTPDLYDTLVGKADETLLNIENAEADIKQVIDDRLTDIKHGTDKDYAELRKAIEEQGIIYVRETLFTQIMGVVDKVEITTNNGFATPISAAGVQKSRELLHAKNEVLQTIVEHLAQAGIHYTPTEWIRLTLGKGKTGTNEKWNIKRQRSAGTGISIWGNEVIHLYAHIDGWAAFEYNYKKVINANLSDVQKAKYIWWEVWLLGNISPKAGELQWYAEVNRQQDPVMGINQLDKQYEVVSTKIFNFEGADTNQLKNKEYVSKFLNDKITENLNDPFYGAFVQNNVQHLQDNISNIIDYMDAYEFFGDKKKIDTLADTNKKKALNHLLIILQGGNREARRQDIISNLHSNIAITKLSFGYVANIGGFNITRKNTGPDATTSSGWTPEEGNIETWGSETQWHTPKLKVGIAGRYIWANISTRVNSYVPNADQYLYTQYEIGQGKNMDFIENPSRDLNKYAEYLTALYNDRKERLSITTNDSKDKLIIEFKPKEWETTTLAQFLNIHTTSEAEENFSLDGNILEIGNVGDIWAYTVAEATGVRRILSLGSKKLDETYRVSADKTKKDIKAIEYTEDGNLVWEKERIQSDVIASMTGNGKSLDIAKTNTAKFFDTEGKLIAPTGAKVTFIPTTIENQPLEQGKLEIRDLGGNNYTVTLNPLLPKDKLTIDYIIETEYTTAYEIAKNDPNNYKREKLYSESAIEANLAMPKNIQNVFTSSTEQWLSIFDDYENTLYKTFMENIVDTQLDAFIDNNDYDNAFSNLKTILENNAKYTDFPDLKALIDSPLSDYEKVIIVDKFKTIFSYILILTDGKIDGANVYAYARDRGTFYTTMEWPDNTTVYPLTKDYKTDIINKLQPENALTRQRVENLVGFTAFYRLNGDGRKYAMTPIGGTNILAAGQTNSMTTIADSDISKTQEWFINNLEVNIANRDILIDRINLLLASEGITITNTQLPDLLRWKWLILDSWKKITIDMERVFYLLGECGNESIWTLIKGIEIHTMKDIPITGKYTWTGQSEKKYIGGIDMSGKALSTTMHQETEQFDLSARNMIHNKLPEPTPEVSSWQTTDSWVTTNTDQNSWWTTNPTPIIVKPITTE